MRNDSDGFIRWDAAQQLGVQVLNDMIAAVQNGEEISVDPRLIAAYRSILLDESLDKAMVALMLKLPSEAYMTEISEEVDVHAINQARTLARLTIAEELQQELWQVFRNNHCDDNYQPSA